MSKKPTTKIKQSREVIEHIRMLRGRNVTLTAIAKIVNLTEDEVADVISSLSTEINAMTEMLSSVDSYSSMISDMSMLISDLKESKKPEDRKELGDYIKQRSDLQKEKINLLTKIIDIQTKEKEKPGSTQTVIKTYSESETTPPEPSADTSFIEPPKPPSDNIISENKKICKMFCYNVLAILSQLGFTRETLIKEGVNKKDRRIITSAVGCTRDEFKIIISRIKRGKFPIPKNEVEIRLRQAWRKQKKDAEE